ncbi:MAG: hypothetical protein WA939_13960 [Nodosilinea sp.]
MPKRFWVGPLGVHDDDWLLVWAWLNNRSKGAQASSLVSFRIRERKSAIREMLEYTAGRMGLEPDELMRQILNKEISPGDVDLSELKQAEDEQAEDE